MQANADYGRMVAEMDKNEHAFDVNAPGERPIVPNLAWNTIE